MTGATKMPDAPSGTNASAVGEHSARVQPPLHHMLPKAGRHPVQRGNDLASTPLDRGDRLPGVAEVGQVDPPAGQPGLVRERAGEPRLVDSEEPAAQRESVPLSTARFVADHEGRSQGLKRSPTCRRALNAHQVRLADAVDVRAAHATRSPTVAGDLIDHQSSIEFSPCTRQQVRFEVVIRHEVRKHASDDTDSRETTTPTDPGLSMATRRLHTRYG